KVLKNKTAGNANVRHNVISAIWQYGPPAVPLLVAALKDDNTSVRQQALYSLQNIQADLSANLDDLLPLLKDGNQNVRHQASYLLGKAGPKAIPHFLTGLQDKEPYIRQGALNALVQIQN